MAIEAVLKEELERLREAEKSYRKEIGALPKGSIQRKRIKGKVYLYLAFREGKKVVSRYLGPPSQDLEKLSGEIERRRKQQQMLRDVQRNMIRIQRMVYGRRSAV